MKYCPIEGKRQVLLKTSLDLKLTEILDLRKKKGLQAIAEFLTERQSLTAKTPKDKLVNKIFRQLYWSLWATSSKTGYINCV